MTTLRINRFLPFTNVEGPGKRACIWVQGCLKKCEGCITPDTWPINGGKQVNTKGIIDEILKISSSIEGVTFSGGEPFLQAKQLFEIGKHLKEKSDLSILTYTGYEYSEIIKKDKPDWNNLLSVTDILIDGPYLQDYQSDKNLIGSSNQKVHFLTHRYLEKKEEILNAPPKIEFHIQPDSTVVVVGNIETELLRELEDWMIIKK